MCHKLSKIIVTGLTFMEVHFLAFMKQVRRLIDTTLAQCKY